MSWVGCTNPTSVLALFLSHARFTDLLYLQEKAFEHLTRLCMHNVEGLLLVLEGVSPSEMFLGVATKLTAQLTGPGVS